MFIYNTTFVVKESGIEEWSTWMKDNYYPVISQMVPGASVKTYELMLAKEDDSLTLSVQWSVSMPDELQEINQKSTMLTKILGEVMGERCLSFSSILREFSN